MKFNKILILFGVTLPVSVLLRFLQIAFTVDRSSGFFKPEQTVVGIVLLCVIAAACLALAIFSRFTLCRVSEKTRNIPAAVFSFFSAGVLAYELVKESFAGTVLAWQLTLLSITGFAAVLFLFAYGVFLIVHYPLPPLCLIIPTIYFLVRLICAFTSISSLALISDYLVMMATYCAGLLFFLNFAKVQNDIDIKKSSRKLLGSGLCFILLSVVESLPYFIFNFVLNKPYTHTTFTANLSLLVFGLFAAVVLLTSLSGKPLKEQTA